MSRTFDRQLRTLRRQVGVAGVLFVSVALLTACSAIDPALRTHVLAADPDGRPIDIVQNVILDASTPHARPRDDSETSRFIHEILRAADSWNDRSTPHLGEQPRRLLISIHGGLNSFSDATGAATRTFRRILLGEDEHGVPDAVHAHYPIFLIWDSSGPTTFGEHLWAIRSGLRHSILGPLSLPLQLGADVGRGIGRAPITVATQLKNELTTGWTFFDAPPAQWVDPVWHLAESEYQRLRWQDGSFNILRGTYERRGPEAALRLISYVALLPFRLAVTPIVLDGFGQEAWNVMIRRTETVFRTPDELNLERARAAREALDDSAGHRADGTSARDPGGAFTYFFRLLRAHVAAQTKHEYRITVVAHSMGALVLTRALAAQPDLRVDDIVFMAPACSVREARDVLVPYLQKHTTSRFWLLTLNRVAEMAEIQWGVGDLVARGSLLEWIDNWYGVPATLHDRRLGKWNNALATLHAFEATDRDGNPVSARIHVKSFFAQPGKVPTRHGEFFDGPFWLRKYWEARDDALNFSPLR